MQAKRFFIIAHGSSRKPLSCFILQREMTPYGSASAFMVCSCSTALTCWSFISRTFCDPGRSGVAVTYRSTLFDFNHHCSCHILELGPTSVIRTWLPPSTLVDSSTGRFRYSAGQVPYLLCRDRAEFQIICVGFTVSCREAAIRTFEVLIRSLECEATEVEGTFFFHFCGFHSHHACRNATRFLDESHIELGVLRSGMRFA